MVRDGDTLTLARHLPARFDISAETRLPPARRGRLAMQIRQDLWRKLRGLRGFSPVIQICAECEGVHVRAGGRLMVGSTPAGTVEKIDALLNDPVLRARWMRWARIGGQG
nr:hypothetical protein [Puniceibacterium sp. IMCC21224]